MSGEKDLAKILKSIDLVCDDKEYVYATTAENPSLVDVIADAVGSFQEPEGQTLILVKSIAQREGVSFDQTYAMLTVNVHTSLEAVGLTAAMARELTNVGVSANVVAAYYHDHIFVPFEDKNKAMSAILNLRNLK